MSEAVKIHDDSTLENTEREQNQARLATAANAVENERPIQRYRRFQSHALVDFQTHRWNPFSFASAVLLDISVQGFKVEFVNPTRLRPGAKAQLIIPLAPFGILAPAKLKLEVEIKWFDAHSLRAGGVFHGLGQQEVHVVEKVIHKLAERDEASRLICDGNGEGV